MIGRVFLSVVLAAIASIPAHASDAEEPTPLHAATDRDASAAERDATCFGLFAALLVPYDPEALPPEVATAIEAMEALGPRAPQGFIDDEGLSEQLALRKLGATWLGARDAYEAGEDWVVDNQPTRSASAPLARDIDACVASDP
ncbi:MAG: hypothetical protein AAFU61_08830 [Pseudomonadota bacterium]